MNTNYTDKQNCPSCGIQYVQHNGLIGTCAELQKAKLKIERLEMNYSDKQFKKIILRLSKDVDIILDYIKNEKALKAELEDFHKREVEKIGKL
jgi:hypothetical protein